MTENKREIPKAYDPSNTEDKWYKYWLDNGLFHSEPNEKPPFTIAIPPPNITGMLTMGHILNNTIQDVYTRLKRMQGFNSCWVPGTDHASIATETKVTKFLQEKEIDKYKIGREEFLKHCQEWRKEYGGIIIQQLKKLGVSCDWRRERFTMDDDYYREVIKAFVDLYKEGKIYRGYRMVNWDPANKSAISDEEVLYRTVNGKLWHFRYPVVGTERYIVVATTRPETMLGDTGVAVNPNDERYKDLIGKKVKLPIVGREIPIFADEYVDMEFGTGAVKVTPAHDVNDYDMGQRHKLEIVNIFNPDATTNKNVPDWLQGLDRFEARKKVIEWFEQNSLMEKVEDYQNKVGYSERGGVPIEPYLSEQWFMKMSELAKPALDVVREGKVKFYPAHWEKTYFHWMENISDWCISRQLWWGHRIPVWYCIGDDHCKIECKEPIVSIDPPEKCPHCGSTNLKQDEDVLDTWASSWIWAHAIFRTEEERKYYYPTSILVTAPDIIFFWVARMIMSGMHFMKDIPFSHVYFTSVIRDLQGRKMSKSLGNSPDPLDVIKEYGADALRFTVLYLAPLGQDVLFSADKCDFGRNFANKIWNAGRFLLMNAENIPLLSEPSNSFSDFADKWIKYRAQHTMNELVQALDNFEPNNATKILYSFVWNDFCDWYVELIKDRLYSNNEKMKTEVLTRAFSTFKLVLQLIHPFMPFLTEELWQLLKDKNLTFISDQSISISQLPKKKKLLIFRNLDNEMDFIKSIVKQVRQIRHTYKVHPSEKIDLVIKNESYFLAFEMKSLSRENPKVENAVLKFNEHNIYESFLKNNTIERLKAIQEIIDGSSYEEAARLATKTEDTIRKWVFIWLEFGIDKLVNKVYKFNSILVQDDKMSYVKKLGKVKKIYPRESVPKLSASFVVNELEIYVPLEGLIDLDVERQRLQKEITRLEGSLAGIEKKLSNEKFVTGAPAEVVEKEKTKQRDWQENLRKLKEIFSNLN